MTIILSRVEEVSSHEVETVNINYIYSNALPHFVKGLIVLFSKQCVSRVCHRQ